MNKERDEDVRRLKVIYDLAVKINEWSWKEIYRMSETDDGLDDLLALCEEIERQEHHFNE